ncbi:asparagine synthase (glutamine-hydrolysing) [Gammaproteobacteria bacterium]
MAAIAGLIDWTGKAAAEAVRRALATLTAHGRDGEALHDGGDVALGWRQKILHAEDRLDRQPLIGAGGRFLSVADVRLDNRNELAALLGLPAERARVLPDSAYVLAAYEEWGAQCTRHLLGSFAFAIWDKTEHRLFLARDPLGTRSLFYYRCERFCFFATMPSALFMHPNIPRVLDEQSLVDELAHLPQRPHASIYRDIYRVTPGHTVTISFEQCNAERYWRPEELPLLRLATDRDYVDAFKELFDEAVRCRLRSLYPIGSHLSSGWDSSSVTVTAAQLLGTEGRRLTAFTTVPTPSWQGKALHGRFADEGPIAAEVAQRFANIDHVLIPGTGRWDLEDLDNYAACFERPRRDAANVGWYDALHQEARRRGIRVMLTGMGGNITISDNGLTLLPRLLRQARFIELWREWRGLRAAGRRWRSILSLTFAPFLSDRSWEMVQRFLGNWGAPEKRFAHLNQAAVRNFRLVERTQGNKRITPASHRADARTQRIHFVRTKDFDFANAGSVAAWDIELRHPAADRRIIEFFLTVPDEQWLHRGETRWLLRRAMTGVLPSSLMGNLRRGHQAADWYETAAKTHDRLMDELTRLSRDPIVGKLLNVAALSALAQDWPLDEPPESWLAARPRFNLLFAISLGRFVRRFQDGNS